MTRDNTTEAVYERLRAGAATTSCGTFIASLDMLHRSEIYNTLGYERLARKNDDIRRFFEECDSDWPQTTYLMLLRTIGTPENKEPFTTLARTVPYAAILRERLVQQNIEAMLIGASGLLDIYPHDEYILALRRNFEYLAAKYNIEPMRASAWRLTNIRPNNFPILRLSQIASFLASTREVMDRLFACSSGRDVYELFGAEASPYWLKHYIPGKESPAATKRIGHMKCNLLAINLVAQMQFAYGSYIDREVLRTRALALLEDTEAEDNSVIRPWRQYGVTPLSAFDSQALLQLSNEYCRHRRCSECPVGRRIAFRAEKAAQRQESKPKVLLSAENR